MRFTAPIVARLPDYSKVKQLEERWRRQGILSFDRIFSEPLGYYLIKEFLEEDYSVDKVSIYLTITFIIMQNLTTWLLEKQYFPK